MPKKPRPPRPQSSIENDDSDDDVFDIELYENEGNAPKPDSSPPTENTGEVAVAVAEIKDTKDVVYDVHKLLKSAFIAILCILCCVLIILLLSFLDIGGVGVGKDQKIDGRSYLGGSSGTPQGWTATADCGEGWLGDEGWMVEGEVVNMGCLWFEPTQMNIQDAVEFCTTNKSSRLVEIYTQLQMTFLQTKMKALNTSIFPTKYFWTGATDEKNEYQWLWRSNDIGVEAFVWYSGYGYNNHASRDDMLIQSNYNYQGLAQSGTSRYPFICQRPS